MRQATTARLPASSTPWPSALRPKGFLDPVQAFVLAGQSYLLAGQHAEGVADLQRSVLAAVRFGQLPRLTAASTRIAAELRASGFGQEADAFLGMLGSAGQKPLPAELSAVPVHPPPRPPTKCPSCGGTIHPGEVEWVDPHSIACDYCGSVVQAESG